MKNATNDPFLGMRGPDLPDGLKDQILARVRAAASLPDPAPMPSLIDRLWESRPLRLAWATAVLLLTAAHIYLGQTPIAQNSVASSWSPVAVAKAPPSFVEEIDPIQFARRHRPSRTNPSGFEARWLRRLEYDRLEYGDTTPLAGMQGGSG